MTPWESKWFIIMAFNTLISMSFNAVSRSPDLRCMWRRWFTLKLCSFTYPDYLVNPEICTMGFDATSQSFGEGGPFKWAPRKAGCRYQDWLHALLMLRRWHFTPKHWSSSYLPRADFWVDLCWCWFVPHTTEHQSESFTSRVVSKHALESIQSEIWTGH